MNHEKRLKRIQKLVPNVMALEFGCRIKHKKRGYGTLIDSTHLVFENEKESIYAPFIDGNCTILGKPITIAVILLAVNSLGEDTIIVDSFGNIKFQDELVGIVYEEYVWDLSKDNFNDQSEETKTFIGGLLN